ncbi:MAG TPA: hypothetical protein VEM59_08175, partial [Acidimicrobiia bacterium]|nr:hypothetical protein [Acidimicrobiia bacterium]
MATVVVDGVVVVLSEPVSALRRGSSDRLRAIAPSPAPTMTASVMKPAATSARRRPRLLPPARDAPCSLDDSSVRNPGSASSIHAGS